MHPYLRGAVNFTLIVKRSLSASEINSKQLPSDSVHEFRSAYPISFAIVAHPVASRTLSMDPCQDVVNGAVSAATSYQGQRTSFIKQAWPVAVVEAGNQAKRLMPRGYAVYAKFAELVANHEAARIQVNILAFYWNTYSCGTRTLTAGPVFFGGGGGAGGGFWCEYQTWKISFDNWASSSFISVHVCYVQD